MSGNKTLFIGLAAFYEFDEFDKGCDLYWEEKYMTVFHYPWVLSWHIFLQEENQVLKMETKTTVRNMGEDLQVGPQLLFQHLVTAGLQCDELIEVFTYELCAFPPALFESKSGMQVAQKTSLCCPVCSDEGSIIITTRPSPVFSWWQYITASYTME